MIIKNKIIIFYSNSTENKANLVIHAIAHHRELLKSKFETVLNCKKKAFYARLNFSVKYLI